MKYFFDQKKINISNYSGFFEEGASYEKFDYVMNLEDGLFYYAKENINNGGGVLVDDNFRIGLVRDDENQYFVDTYNQPDQFGIEFEQGLLVNLEGSEGSDGRYKIKEVTKDVTSWSVDSDFTGSIIKVDPVGHEGITQTVEEGPDVLTINSVDESPSDSVYSWTTDQFFFDADYGSSVTFKCSSAKQQFGNGYFSMVPKHVNCMEMEVDLIFKNRKNKEANAIVHFLETHQGQYDKDKSSPNLAYKQGISGFKWGAESVFFPYNSTNLMEKRFYSQNWEHNLTFENSNNLRVKMFNSNSSILRSQSGLFLQPAEEYSDSQVYGKHDVVYSPINQRHYYWSGDVSTDGKDPVSQSNEWQLGRGYFTDINTDHWTREFYWKPSLGLNINENIQLQKISAQNGYYQIYNTEINESLIKLSLKFEGRSDREAYAILHFLEQRLGFMPFQFTPPAPYNFKKTFVCQTWKHEYVFKNSHTITAEFEELPIDMSAEQFDALIPPSEPIDGELIFESPMVFVSQFSPESITPESVMRARFKMYNIGETDVQVENVFLSNNDNNLFSIIGGANSNVPIVEDSQSNDRKFFLPNLASLGRIAGKEIRLRRSFSEGLSGGYSFIVVDTSEFFIQQNDGRILSEDKTLDIYPDYWINEEFIEINQTNIIEPGKNYFIELQFSGPSYFGLANLLEGSSGLLQVDKDGDDQLKNIEISTGGGYYNAKITVEVGSPEFKNKSAELLAYIN